MALTFFRRNFFWQKFFPYENFVRLNFFWAIIVSVYLFMVKNFLSKNVLFGNFFGWKFILDKKFFFENFVENFSVRIFFFCQILVDLNLLSWKILFETFLSKHLFKAFLSNLFCVWKWFWSTFFLVENSSCSKKIFRWKLFGWQFILWPIFVDFFGQKFYIQNYLV